MNYGEVNIMEERERETLRQREREVKSIQVKSSQVEAIQVKASQVITMQNKNRIEKIRIQYNRKE